MPRIRIQVNYEGIRELLRSPEIEQDLGRRIERVKASAESSGVKVDGEPVPIVTDTSVGSVRARAYARIDHPASMAIEARHGVLTRALDAAGGAS